MNTNKERIIERLKLLSKMRDGGEAGERANAAALMDEIMRKHGIKEEDLEQEEETLFWLHLPDELHMKLFVQIITKVQNKETIRLIFFPNEKKENIEKIKQNMLYVVPRNEEYNTVGAAKKSEFAEAMARYHMYKDDFDKHIDRFFYAYLYKNDLLGEPKEDDNTELDEEMTKERLKSIQMSRSIDRARVLRQIGEGGDQ